MNWVVTHVVNVIIKQQQMAETCRVYQWIFYPCNGCNFKGTTEGIFNKHVKTIHEGVHYTCNQWDHKATTTPNIKRHVEAINELVCYSCKQCQCNGSNNKLLGNEETETNKYQCWCSVPQIKTTQK